ncbi:hypothetical protein AU210_014613 [Fusarium oxysporum f. sp. radicis-cucumerinum]|uniref:Uncharacterized protein n=1 Tax=Fusarium oxysporum f. sp. radicis-cucumerinum TaxID=327505 RepID=A0A2H3G725_FUSOX|nr:hypothetical protein AU210_014613 [Fusarium oxysporum f. sp. radicis-cucumerinum]
MLSFALFAYSDRELRLLLECLVSTSIYKNRAIIRHSITSLEAAATFDSQNVGHFPYFKTVFLAGVGVSSWKKNKTRSANHAYVYVDCYDNLLLSDSESVSSFERPASDK